MAKTNPIGVRFRQDILEKLKKDYKIDSPQKALVFLENYWNMENQKSFAGIIPTIREKEKQTGKPHNLYKPATSVPDELKGMAIDTIDKKNKRHPLWKQGDPPEGSNAFFLRKGAFTYDEIEK